MPPKKATGRSAAQEPGASPPAKKRRAVPPSPVPAAEEQPRQSPEDLRADEELARTDLQEIARHLRSLLSVLAERGLPQHVTMMHSRMERLRAARRVIMMRSRMEGLRAAQQAQAQGQQPDAMPSGSHWVSLAPSDGWVPPGPSGAPWHPLELLRSAQSPPQGIDEGVIDAMSTTLTYGSSSSSGDGSPATTEQQQCMVCFEDFAGGDELRLLPCLHRYHRECIDPWLAQNRHCPICKHDVSQGSGPL